MFFEYVPNLITVLWKLKKDVTLRLRNFEEVIDFTFGS